MSFAYSTSPLLFALVQILPLLCFRVKQRLHDDDDCDGSLLSKQGSCPAGLRCYEPCDAQVSAAFCDGSIAHSGAGKCRVPSGQECVPNAVGSAQCRPGSFCGTQSHPTLETTCMKCDTGLSQPTYCVEQALQDAIDRWSHRYLAEKTVATRATEHFYLADQNNTQFVSRASDHAIGFISFIAKGGLSPIGGGASRSGASFFMTADESMLVKGFDRKEEYDEVVTFIKQFKPAAGGTTFVIPKLAFPAFGSAYWVVMPNAHFVNMHIVGADFNDKSTFDVKPWPLISGARDPMLKRLVEIGFSPPHDEHMDNFNRILDHDLQYLDAHDLCDWSWLINVYHVNEGFELPASLPDVEVAQGGKPWCFSTGPTARSNSVLCFALLDFSLSFATLPLVKKVESKVMLDKWKNYGDKFRVFTNCLFNMNPKSSDIYLELGLVEPPFGSFLVDTGSEDLFQRFKFHITMKLGKKHVPTDDVVHLKGGAGPRYKHTVCYRYRKAACADLLHGVSPNRFSQSCEFLLKPAAYERGDILDNHDDYWLETEMKQKAGYCFAYMVENCQAWLVDALRANITRDHAQNFIFLRP